MKIILKYIIVALSLWLLTGCCLFDNTKVIKKVAAPMLKELRAFQKKNKRFPTIKERDIMLDKSGCKLTGNICIFEGEKFMVVRKGEGNFSYDLSIQRFEKGTSHIIASCGVGLTKLGKRLHPVICSQELCISLRQ